METKLRPDVILRWIAHAWGIASTLLLLAFVFGGREHLRFTASEALAFLLFPGGVVAGFIVAWRHELTGGCITVASFALFCVLLFANSGRWSAGPYFLLFTAPGFLHIAAALTKARFQRRNEAAPAAL